MAWYQKPRANLLHPGEMMDTPDNKQLVLEELNKGNPDWKFIERLSRGEVDSNPTSVRFSVDAGHIQRLGFELVAKQDTALAELIKNSYDADATKVVVKFKNHDKVGGTLVIEDNGTGMTVDTVRDAWMRISTTSKFETPVSPRYGRIRAGRKGIGRFAVQRLGTKLILESDVQGASKGIRVVFDWDQSFQAGQLLNDVFSQMEEYDKPTDSERTSLTIIGLRESWSDAMIDRVWRAVFLLQPPFPVSRRPILSKNKIYEPEPGFEVVINGTSSRNNTTRLSIKSTLLDHALADINGEICPDGSAYVRLRSIKFGLDEVQHFETKFLLTGPVIFSAKYFIYESDTMSGMNKSQAADYGRKYGGIRIYRNGFRVPPYGDQSDDWLNLDLDVGRRKLLPAANNRNFFGQVELDGTENPLFEETSSREGLIENEAFEELVKFVRSGLEWSIIRVAATRQRKQTSGQKDFVSTARPRKPSEVLGNLIEGLSSEKSNEADNQKIPLPVEHLKVISSAQEEILNWEKLTEEREASLLRYEEILRVLASLGISIAIFGHEIKGARDSIAAYLSVLDEKVEELFKSEQKKCLLRIVSGFHEAIDRMFDVGTYIAGLMSSTESRELSQLSVKGAIERFINQFKKYMERQQVEFEFNIEPAHLRTIEMHSSELDSVLLNFLTNAIKSMKKSKVYPRRIRITAMEQNEFVLIAFEDNGSGVPSDIASHIFDAFFTTTLGADADSIAGPGTGLGLKIVSDIATSYGGTVKLATPSSGFNCRMEFRILTAQASRRHQRV